MAICLIIFFLVIGGFIPFAQAQDFAQMEEVQLSKPIAHYTSTLFEDSVAVSFSLTYPESTIHYTTDGSQPTIDSPVFTETKCFKTSTLLKAVAFHPYLQSSPILGIDFVRASTLKGVKRIELLTLPNEKYKGNGAASLLDFQKGSLNFREKAWVGFDDKTVEIKIKLKKKIPIQNVVVSVLADHGSWIFLPKKVEIRTKKASFVADWEVPTSAQPKQLKYLSVPLAGVNTKYLHLVIHNAAAIPNWHSGAGNAPWLFVDEVIVN